jgi:type IV pilus assembly protein PilA
MRGNGECGFTLVELMVVVLVIGILLAIAIPVFANSARAAAQRACWANQREVDGAWQTYRSSTAATSTAPGWSDLMDELVPEYLKDEPECPDGGTYLWDGSRSDCTLPDHVR